MLSLLHCVCFFFIICLSADSAMALAFPLTLKDTTFHTLDASARSTSLTELAILFTFTMAIIWLIVGAYVLSAITEARASAVLRSLRRNALSRLGRLDAFSLSPFTVIGGTGRAGLVPRRTSARRGGLSYPMSAFRPRRYQQQSRGALPT